MVVLLTAGEMLAVPVAQDLCFGVLSSAGGTAVLIGSTVVGALLDPAVAAPAVPWLVLASVPAVSAVIIGLLARRGSLTP
jgi:hypothetical protein